MQQNLFCKCCKMEMRDPIKATFGVKEHTPSMRIYIIKTTTTTICNVFELIQNTQTNECKKTHEKNPC